MSSTDWYPSAYYIQPHYSTIPIVRVYDLAAPRLKHRRKRFWRKARNAALNEWHKAGLYFSVYEMLDANYGCDRITLDIADTDDGTAGQAAFEYPPCAVGCEGCAWSHISPMAFEQAWLSRITTPLRHLIGHELGHNLGFGHGGTGIMASPGMSNVVGPEEIAAIQEYWL